MSVKQRLSRRSFLKTTGAVAAGMTALSARNYARAAGANERMTTAYIGCGHIAKFGHVKELSGSLLKEGKLNILAACDVYRTRAQEFQGLVKEAGGDVKLVDDYHEILGMKDVDYVTIATPEHWHAKMAIEALSAGKHVYVEKPITHTIEEATEVVAKVKETGLKLQVGVQGMSDDSYMTAYEAIVAGKIGTVVNAQIEYCRDYPLDRGPWRRDDVDLTQMATKPADLDWDAWLGPAPKRAWDPHRYFE